MAQETPQVIWRDRLGICLSVLCLAHCLGTPLILALVPVSIWGTISHFLLPSESSQSGLHWGLHSLFLILVPTLALVSFVPGYRRHRSFSVVVWAVGGTLGLILGVLDEQIWHFFELHVGAPTPVLTVIGALALIRAHWLNRKLCQCCAHGHQ